MSAATKPRRPKPPARVLSMFPPEGSGRPGTRSNAPRAADPRSFPFVYRAASISIGAPPANGCLLARLLFTSPATTALAKGATLTRPLQTSNRQTQCPDALHEGSICQRRARDRSAVGFGQSGEALHSCGGVFLFWESADRRCSKSHIAIARTRSQGARCRRAGRGQRRNPQRPGPEIIG